MGWWYKSRLPPEWSGRQFRRRLRPRSAAVIGALIVAPAGTPVISIDSVSLPPVSGRLLLIVKAMLPSSSPGASATAATWTSIVALVEATVSSLSSQR